MDSWVLVFSTRQLSLACKSTIHRKVREQDMVLELRRVVLLHALFSAWCVAQQRTGDGRVILNLGYFATYEGSYVSSGEGAWLHAMVGMRGRCNRSTCGREGYSVRLAPAARNSS